MRLSGGNGNARVEEFCVFPADHLYALLAARYDGTNTQISPGKGFPPGLDRAGSRRSIVMVFTLFKGSFEAVFLHFRSSEGPWDSYPG